MPDTRDQRKRQLEREEELEWELEQKRKFLRPNHMECSVNLGEHIDEHEEVLNSNDKAETTKRVTWQWYAV